MQANQKIPEGWSVKKLGEVTTLLTNGFVGSATPHYTEDETGVIYIQGFNVNINSFDLTGIKKVTLEFHKKNKKSCLQEGDLLTIQTGDIGVTARVPKYLAGSNCHALIISRFDTAICNSKFYLQYYNSSICQSRFKKIETGSTMKHLNVGDLESEYIPVPPLPEQEKIADILGTWDEAIEKLSSLIEQKKLLKKGLMQRLLTGKTRLNGFTQPWKEVKLGEIGTITSAGVDKKIVEGEKLVKLLNYMDVYRKDFLYSSDMSMTVSAPERQIKNCDLKKGDIFFTPSSETRDDIAHSAVVIEDIGNGVYSYHIVRLRPTKPIDLKFSAYAFKTDMFYRQAYAWCAGSGQRYVLSQDDFRNMRVFIPSDITEQKAIADVLSTADDEINLLNQKLEALKEQKKGLMQQLLTGQIRVKVN